MKELLCTENLQVSFALPQGTLQAVRGVSFCLNERETLALAGESGCGKSVTAKSILRLNPSPPAKLTGGAIRLLGRDVTAATEREMNEMRGGAVGMVFQDPMSSLNPSMRIWEQVTDGLRKHKKLSRAQCRREAAALLEMVQIPQPGARADQYPHELSGGMRQRVMIAMALACKPQILIADEPTTALDVTVQAEILSLLQTLQGQLGMSTLLITHDLAVAANTADRIAVMYAGRIVETGPVCAVFSAPAHPYIRALFRSHPANQQHGAGEMPFIPGALPDLTQPISGCAFAPRCANCMPHCTQAEPPCTVLSPGHTVSCFLHGTDRITHGEGLR